MLATGHVIKNEYALGRDDRTGATVHHLTGHASTNPSKASAAAETSTSPKFQ